MVLGDDLFPAGTRSFDFSKRVTAAIPNFAGLSWDALEWDALGCAELPWVILERNPNGNLSSVD